MDVDFQISNTNNIEWFNNLKTINYLMDGIQKCH